MKVEPEITELLVEVVGALEVAYQGLLEPGSPKVDVLVANAIAKGREGIFRILAGEAVVNAKRGKDEGQKLRGAMLKLLDIAEEAYPVLIIPPPDEKHLRAAVAILRARELLRPQDLEHNPRALIQLANSS